MLSGINPTELQLHDLLDTKFNLIPTELFDDENDKEDYYNSAHEQVAWLYEHFKERKPLFTEYQFTIDDLFSGIDLPFNGTIDRVEGSIINKEIELIDYKTGKIYTKRNIFESNIQACIYCKAWYKLFGFYPKYFTFYFSRYKKIRQIPITKEFIERGEERIKSIYYHMVNGEFEPPNKPNKFFCNHFCTVKKDCPKFKTPKGWGMV